MSGAFVSAGKGELTGGRRRRRGPGRPTASRSWNATTVSFEVRTISGSGGRYGGWGTHAGREAWRATGRLVKSWICVIWIRAHRRGACLRRRRYLCARCFSYQAVEEKVSERTPI